MNPIATNIAKAIVESLTWAQISKTIDAFKSHGHIMTPMDGWETKIYVHECLDGTSQINNQERLEIFNGINA